MVITEGPVLQPFQGGPEMDPSDYTWVLGTLLTLWDWATIILRFMMPQLY